MKILLAMAVLVSLYGCVYGDDHEPLMTPVILEQDTQLAYKCTFDPYNPKCAVD
ncbi:hypothetical protein [Pseudomonas sp. Z3-6]|uniref:hypothetical protein n=1 Tax=Pseudomonas sp. Z3-6 TaxID=2817411 RepID=UPI003DA921CA